MKNDIKVTINSDNSITIDWDETDPKYSYLNELTPEEFSELLSEQIQNLIEETK